MTKCHQQKLLLRFLAGSQCQIVANNISEIVSDRPRDQPTKRGGEDGEGHPAPDQHQRLRLPPRGQL